MLRYIQLDNPAQNAQKNFISNYIRTTKYTMWSYIPMGLAYQFLRFTNCYFMLMTILACTDLSPISPATAINPMVFVLVV